MATGKTARQVYTLRTVESLSGEDIGRIVRFYTWDLTREIAVITTAELRQLSHDGSATNLTYGLLAEREQYFHRGEKVCLDPPYDYSDVSTLRQEYHDFHEISEDGL